MHPLMCWDIILNQFSTLTHRSDLKTLIAMKKQYGWNVDFNPVLKNEFDALVLTDLNQRICWVNKEFQKMTGYTAAFLRHKNLSFLQGKRTSLHVFRKIREAVASAKPIRGSIINYRKDGSTYNCSIEILPLLTSEKMLVHFLTIERVL